MKTIELICDFPLIQFIILIITILGFIITLLTFWKTKKIRESQIEYKKNIYLDDIINILEISSATFEDILKKSNTKNIDSTKLFNLIKKIDYSLGSIKAINNMLFDSESDSNVKYYSHGYYDDTFFRDIILNAKKRIIIYGKRNTRCFKQENIIKLLEKSKNDLCQIELAFFSPDMSNILLEEIRKSVPFPPNTIDELKESQNRYKKDYLLAKNNIGLGDSIKYYEYLEFPLCQFVIVDDTLYWGLVNFNKELSKPEIYANRPFLEMSINDKFAARIIENFNLIKEKCKDNNLVF